MDWQEVFKQVATILGGVGAGVAALAWFAQKIVSHFLSRDIESSRSGRGLTLLHCVDRYKATMCQGMRQAEA